MRALWRPPVTQSLAARDRCRRAINALRNLPCVPAATLYPPSEDTHDDYSFEATITQAGVPPSVLRELALEDLALHSMKKRGSPVHTIVSVAA